MSAPMNTPLVKQMSKLSSHHENMGDYGTARLLRDAVKEMKRLRRTLKLIADGREVRQEDGTTEMVDLEPDEASRIAGEALTPCETEDVGQRKGAGDG